MPSLKSNYCILLDHNLVIEYHQGVLDAASYINFKKKLVADPKFKSNLNHLINFKQVKFATTKKDIQNFVEFMGSNVEKLGNRKVAFVTSTPNQVVSTTIYKTLKSNLTQSSEIFSTNEKALKWLNFPEITTLELKAIIVELAQKTR
jgi:hypothetical protein